MRTGGIFTAIGVIAVLALPLLDPPDAGPRTPSADRRRSAPVSGCRCRRRRHPGDGVWAASIGLNQNVTHRVLVKDDGSSCLKDDRGTLISCTDDESAGTGGSTGPAPAADGIPADISALTDEQLRSLMDVVTDEIFARAGTRP